MMAIHRSIPEAHLRNCPGAQLLTEAEISEMGDTHYMNAEQKRFFRDRLIASETLLRDRTREAATEIATAAVGADPVDRASAEEEHQLAIGARVRDASRLLEIRAALARLEADEYGWCLETGEKIGVSRLLISPTITLCVEAQQRHEDKKSRYRV